MHYNKINYVHIPKTAGWYIRHELLDFVLDPLEEKGVSFLEVKDHYHTGWNLVDDQTYVITSFRDPVKRLVSHFTYMCGLRDYYYYALNSQDYPHGLRLLANSVVQNTKQVWNYQPTIEDLYRWIEDNKNYLTDYQSKNIMLDYDINDHQLFWNDFYFDLVGKGLKKEQVYYRLGKINILLKDTQLNDFNMKKLRDKIKSDFDLDSVSSRNNYWIDTDSVSPWNKGDNSFEGSPILFEKLSQEDKDYIYSFNKIDTEIYNDNSIFWNSGF